MVEQLNIPYKFYASRTFPAIEQSLARHNIDPDIATALRDAFNALTDMQNEYERNNNLAIERWANRNVVDAAPAQTPYVVVADDGTGQYTSIKAAIDAIPTGLVPAGNIPTVILVKATGNGNVYNDAGAGAVNVDGKKFALVATPPLTGAASAFAVALQWTFDGFTTGANSTYCYIQDLRFDTGITATPVFGGGPGAYQIGALRCAFNTSAFTGGSSLFGTIARGEFVDCDMTSTALFSSAGVNTYDNITVLGGVCSLSQVGTITVGNSTNKIFNLRVRDCELRIPGGTTINVYQSLSGTDPGTGSWIFDGCRIINATGSAGNTTINHSYIGQVQYTNCILGHQTALGVSEPALTLSLYIDTSGSYPTTTLIDSALFNCTVQLNNAGHFAYVAGAYQQLILSGSNIRADVTLWGNGATGISFITCSGSYCSISAAIKEGGGGGNTGITVSGNNNIITAAGASTCATPTNNTGAGNAITTT